MRVDHDRAVDSLGTSLHAVIRLLESDDDARPDLPVPEPGSPLATLGDAFDLGDFERGVLLLAVAREVAAGIDVHCARWNGSAERPWVTPRMALAVLPRPDWEAFVPTSTLRRDRLVRLGPGDVLTERPVFVDERVLHHLLGATYVDPRVERRTSAVPVGPLTDGEQQLAAVVADQLGRQHVHLWSETAHHGIPVVAAAAALGSREVRVVGGGSIPVDPAELDEFSAVLRRESRLGGFTIVIDLDGAVEPVAEQAALALARRLGPACVTTGVDARAGELVTRHRLRRPPFEERVTQWNEALADLPPVGGVRAMVARFALDGAELRAAVADVRRALGDQPDADPSRLLWDAARAQAHPRLEDLAQRIDVRRTWSDLVVPEAQQRALRALLGHARHQVVVDHDWGFTPDGAPGGGSAAVFAGASGTGKTLAAEVLANELGLDLFRIDLSAVVSKFIGETEKNLRRVFDAAESGGAVLLFDEADALFGKRTEVKDSHDRHANIEVSYLLQRMESFGGLALLTTNHRKHLDDAFLRRIPFVVEFPFPTPDDRAAIWSQVFPNGTPLDGLDVRRLAQLNVAGGNIRTIARNAAALAADAGGPVTMALVRVAAELEFDKMGRSLTPAEVRGW